MPFEPRYYKADEAHAAAQDGETTYRVLVGTKSGFHNLSPEEVVEFHQMKSGERRKTLNTRDMEMHEHWPPGSENVGIFMDFDKMISASSDNIKAELEFNERSVANVMYTAYGAIAGLNVDCLRAYNATLEMQTFSEFDSNVVYECECKQCATFSLPEVRVYKCHRRGLGNTLKCSIHCTVRGERHCTNARQVVRAIVASIDELKMHNVFISGDKQSGKKFAFDWLPYSTRSLRTLGSTKGTDSRSVKELTLLFKNGRACVLQPVDLEFNVANLNNSLVRDKSSQTIAFEALKLHPSVDLKCEQFADLLARNGIQMPNLPSNQVLATSGPAHARTGTKRPADADISAVSTGSRPFTSETERRRRESLCQKVKIVFRLRNNLPTLKVTKFFCETTDPGLGGGTRQRSQKLATDCKACPNRNGGGSHKQHCLQIISTPYGIKNDTQTAPISGWCFSKNHIPVSNRDKMQAWLAPQTLHEDCYTHTSSKAQVSFALQAPQSKVECIEHTHAVGGSCKGEPH